MADIVENSPLPPPPTDKSSFTPQEQYLYDHHLANLANPVVNEDGSHSTLSAITAGFGDKTYLLPTIWDNKRVGTDEAIERAKAAGIENFPSYGSVEEADKRYMGEGGLHSIMEKDQPGQASAAADARGALEAQAQAKRSRVISEQQKAQGIGMEEPGFKAEGPNADVANKELTDIRTKAHWPQWQPLPNYYEKFAQARAEGHSREEIDKYTADLRAAAAKEGYSNDEINYYMMGVSPRQHNGDAKPNPTMGATADFLRDWQDKLFGPHNLAGAMSLPTPGAMTGGAVWQQLGWSMFDAAKTFPGGVVGGVAAIAELGDGTEKTDGETAKLLWEASQAVGAFAPFLGKFGKTIRMPHAPLEGDILPPGPRRPAGPGLPPREGPPTLEGEFTHQREIQSPAVAFPKFIDFMDGATGIAQKHPEGMTPETLAITLRDLGDHFVATGDHPVGTASAHPTYESFTQRMESLRSNGFLSDANTDAVRAPTAMPAELGVDEARGSADFADNLTKTLKDTTALSGDGLAAAVADNFKRLMSDESGAIKWPFWRTDIRPDEMFRPDPMKYGEVVDNARAIFSPASLSPRAAGRAKSIMAWTALDVERAVHRLNQYGRYVGELSTDNRYNMIAAYQRGLMDVIENNRPAFEAAYPVGDPMRFMADKYLQPGSPLFGLMKEIQFQTDETWKEMDRLGIAPGYVHWYYPGQWKETQAARAFLGKGKLGAGSKNFTTAKSIPDILEGIQAGLTPTSDNPIQVIAARVASQQQYIRAFKTLQAFEADGSVVPAAMVTKDMLADGYTKVSDFFALPGQNVAAKWAHPDAARILKAMTDNGFAKYSLYRIARQAANFVTSINLLGPGFHATFVTLDAMSTDLALGTQELSRALFNPTEPAMWKEAGHAAISMLRAPLAPMMNVRQGMAMKQLALNPGLMNQPTIMGLPTNLVSDAMKNYMEGGGRFGLDDIYKSSRQGQFWGALKSQVTPSDGRMTFTQEIGQMMRDAQGDINVGGAMKLPAWTALFTGRMLGRLGDTMAAPLMAFYVPMLKAGTFYRHMESAMRVAPNMGPTEVQRVAGNISSMIDNRFGEMVYDNKFWNAYQKTAGQLVFRAMGFNYGALDTLAVGSKEIASAVVGRPDRLREPLPTVNATTGEPDVQEIKQFGSKASALIGMVMFTALAGAMIGGLEGTFNDDWKPYDYLYPKLASGQRIKLPSHMNNAYEFYNHPGQSMRNRVNGLWVMGHDAATNTQWDGKTPIAPPKHSFEAKMGDYADWMQHQMWPYALQQMIEPTEAQQDIDPALRMLGVGPAPWEIRNPEKAQKYEQKTDKARDKAWEYQQKKKAAAKQKGNQ